MIEALNTDCFCVSLDREALRHAIEKDPAAGGLHGLIAERCPHLFAALPVFVSRRQVDAMATIISAVEEVVRLPAYREAALAWAPAIARYDPGTPGVFMGYDFHLGVDGPRLIELNTNAGGALLNALLARAQRACCDEIAALVTGPVPAEDLERAFVDMFRAEWHAAGRAGAPRRIAIVDDAPESQYLYPEFLLFAQLFRRHGIDAIVRAPQELDLRTVDLVYNRLTDFALDAHPALRAAYLAGDIVLTPHPRAHALYADKRNLTLLSDPDRLRAWGVAERVVAVLSQGIARTEPVTPQLAERLWSARRKLFFKPAAGHGGKGAYRGDKLTRRVWSEILGGRYVAQQLVPPGERRLGAGCSMKADIRNYAYRGAVLLLAARLYQGQTTNFRTERGGFSPVLTPSRSVDLAVACDDQPKRPVM